MRPEDKQRIDELQQQLARRDTTIRELQATHQVLEARVKELEAKIAQPAQSVGLGSLSGQISTLLEKQEERLTGAGGSIAGVLQSVDLELRGFFELTRGEPAFVAPQPGSAVDANALSLLRMSFSSVPRAPPGDKPR